ncbi:MAG: hypothetical protein M1818_001505 [Claussenomyces sp. TS43310]|nr:MAG: hypothetical protein M1818_001505 [Claussenomyces sp. TS43310]
MNDDPTATHAADLPSVTGEGSSAAAGPAHASDNEAPPIDLREHVLAQVKKKADFINDIMLNLDLLIYAELCIIYCMDCSFFRLLVRFLAQLMFLTPKPQFVQAVPKHHPYVGAIFGTNFFCLLLHTITKRPQAGELTRGYLHGSLFIDFIGQKGPTSKLQLIALDFLILALQCFMLAVHVEKERLKAIQSPDSPAPASILSLSAAAITAQDHDTEERGLIRAVVTDSNDGMEMQDMASVRDRGRANTPQTRQEEEQEHLLSEAVGSAGIMPQDGPLDIFYSGNVVVAEFHVVQTLRNQWADHDTASTTALRNVGHTAGYNWARVQHRLARLEAMR